MDNVRKAGYYSNIAWWQSGFLIQIGLSIVITYILYKTAYFWISIAFYAVLYVIAIGFIYYHYYNERRSEYFYPLKIWCPCILAAPDEIDGNDLTECFEVDLDGVSIECIICYPLILIPLSIYMIILPLYIWLLSFWMVFSKQNMSFEAMAYINSMIIGYMLPQNILHLVVLFNYNNIDIALYLLLIINLFISVVWYSSFCYVAVRYDDVKYFEENVEWISQRFIWSGFMVEILLIVLLIFIYYDLPVITLYMYIPAILAIPLSMPVLCVLYENKTQMIQSPISGLFGDWIMSSNEKEEILDRTYCTVHAMRHQEKSENNEAQQKQDENGTLLVDKDAITINMHTDNNIMLCLRYQYDYFKLDLHDKIAFFDKKLEYKSIWNRFIKFYKINKSQWRQVVVTILCVIYVISRVYLMILPLFWPFYQMHFCDDNIGCVYDIFMSVLIGFYVIVIVVFIKSWIELLRYEYWFGYLYLCGYNVILYDPIKEFRNNMIIYKILFDIMHYDIAMVIGGYIAEKESCTFKSK